MAAVGRATRRLQREAAVRGVGAADRLDEQQLSVEFQPQYDLVTNGIVGAEALVRWNRPATGVVAARGVRRRRRAARPRPPVHPADPGPGRRRLRPMVDGRPPPSVAVNVGARSLMDDQFPDNVAAVLAWHGLAHLPAHSGDHRDHRHVEARRRGGRPWAGCAASVSRSASTTLAPATPRWLSCSAPRPELKVDRSFVSGMLTQVTDRALVRATIQFALALGARAVAEGVESQGLLTVLTSVGCDVAQRFHLRRPMRAEHLRTLLEAQPLPAPRDGTRRLKVV